MFTSGRFWGYGSKCVGEANVAATLTPSYLSPVPRINGHSKSERTVRDSAMGYDSPSVMSSELESSSFVDSEDDDDASR